jgi:hypothetical protein
VFQSAFGVAFVLDASIQMPAGALVPAGAAVPAAAVQVLDTTPKPAAAGFARVELLAVILMLALVGCETLGLVTAKTPAQQLTYATSIQEGLARGLTNANQTQAISPADGQKVGAYLDQTDAGLKAARVAIGGCVVAGQPVATVQGIAPAPAGTPITLPGVAALALQSITCNPSTTAVDQLLLVNNILQQLSAYYATKGMKTGQ